MTLLESEVRLAVVGSSHHALYRAQLLKHCHCTTVTRVASTDDLLPMVSADWKTPEDWREAVCSADVDAVVVCAPIGMRFEVTVAAMEAGKHVLCDQPVAHTPEAVLSLARMAKELHVVLKCSRHDWHRPAIRKVKEWVDSKRIGDPLVVQCRVAAPPGPYVPMGSRSRILVELTVRAIHLARWMFGDLKHVGDVAGFSTDVGVEALVEDPDGRVARIQASVLEGSDGCSVHVLASRGYAFGGPATSGGGEERAGVGQRDFDRPFRETLIDFVEGDLAAQARRLDWLTFTDSLRSGVNPADLRDDIEVVQLATAVPGLMPVEQLRQVM